MTPLNRLRPSGWGGSSGPAPGTSNAMPVSFTANADVGGSASVQTTAIVLLALVVVVIASHLAMR